MRVLNRIKWRRERRKENKAIADAIMLFEHGQYREKKEYIRELKKGNAVQLNGFTFCLDTWIYQIWKETDLGKQPQFKGEPLVKVVPKDVPYKNIPKVLNAQCWMYI